MVPVPILLLCLFIACAVLSLLLCGLARTLFSKFRSGEYKPGQHRSDIPAVLPAGGREIKTIELPLVGGVAFTPAIVATGIAAGFLLNFTREQWFLLIIGLSATVGYMLVGFVDDWHKVHSKAGISERAKLAGVLLVSVSAAFCYYWLSPNGREPYTPYKELLGPIFNIPYVWLIFLMLMTGLIGSVTSLSVDFSDGLDGLAGGLVFSASLAFGIIVIGIINNQHPEGIVVEVLSLLCASSVLGYLPWNWPSSWAARRGTAKRHARIYMGDSGALGLGGILAMMAIFSRQEILLLMVGGAFVLEGLSALMSAKVLTPFFRRHLKSLRFTNTQEHIPHTEFPLPFLATPLHHHFDLLGWDRRRLVYGAWALGACFALMGVFVGLVPETWERYLGRILVLVLALLVWSSGSWTRSYFIGKYPPERTRRRRLALYYGFPFRLMGLPLYHRVEIIEASEDIIETPAEEVTLWQRMSIFDVRAMLGLYCYRAGYYPAALAQWTRIPEGNRALRPEIAHLLAEVDNRLALEKQVTQPLRRDEIVQQPPFISGNLPLADMPNPHEPVRLEETQDGRNGSWNDADFYEEDDEKHLLNSSLGSQAGTLPATNGHDSSMGTSALSPSASMPVRQNWLIRLVRPFPHKKGSKGAQ